MGVVEGVGSAAWPQQSEHVGRWARVLFAYEAASERTGLVVRDDIAAPWVTLIALPDGRFVRGTECQWSPHGGYSGRDLRALLPLRVALGRLRKREEMR